MVEIRLSAFYQVPLAVQEVARFGDLVAVEFAIAPVLEEPREVAFGGLVFAVVRVIIAHVPERPHPILRLVDAWPTTTAKGPKRSRIKPPQFDRASPQNKVAS